jgi:hypothetical protein
LDDAFTVATDDIFTGSLFTDNGSGEDSDIDIGDSFTVTQLQGTDVPQNGNTTIVLESGVHVSINSDGSFNFDTNGIYDHLLSGETASESFSYEITDSFGATDTATASMTIEGVVRELSVSDASISEADSGNNSALAFTISLSSARSSDVTVDYMTSGNTASAVVDADFRAQTGSLTFAAGETEKTVYIDVLGDNAHEDNETINFHLSNAQGADIVDANAIGTIINNDNAQTGPLAVAAYNSKSDASKVLYLDFDGATVTGTAWNNYLGSETIEALAYGQDSDSTSFSSSELASIQEIWERVSEDYLPFDVNVTTDRAVYDATSSSDRAITVITDSDLLQAGGVAYLDVWGSQSDYYQPAWAFSNMLGNGYAKYVAEAVSHEIGHNLGLEHDGSSSTDYYTGHGSGETGWASIMGVGYYRNVSQWSKGEYGDANNQQDDLAYLSSRLGYRTDDHGNDNMSASLINLGAGLAAEGIIEQNTDVDIFKYISEGGEFTFNVSPNDVGPNLDLLLVLKDANGNTLATDNDANELDASITYSAEIGTELYLEISGTGKEGSNGYSDYGSLGYYNVELA